MYGLGRVGAFRAARPPRFDPFSPPGIQLRSPCAFRLVCAVLLAGLFAAVPSTAARAASPAARGSTDCNFNGIDDADEVAQGTAADCNGNQTPDDCDVHESPTPLGFLIPADLRVPPDPFTSGTTTHDFLVADTGPILDLDVTINVTHSFMSDLKISLEHNAVTVVLSDSNGGGGSGYVDTVFDDEAADPVSTGSAPFTGSFQPEEPLATFDGMDTAGTWTLIVEDLFTGDIGTLHDWSLDFQIQGAVINDCQPNGTPDSCEPDFDTDGLPDECDTCTDTDSDGFGNSGFDTSGCTGPDPDNCPDLFNPDQEDADSNGIGDACQMPLSQVPSMSASSTLLLALILLCFGIRRLPSSTFPSPLEQAVMDPLPWNYSQRTPTPEQQHVARTD